MSDDSVRLDKAITIKPHDQLTTEDQERLFRELRSAYDIDAKLRRTAEELRVHGVTIDSESISAASLIAAAGEQLGAGEPIGGSFTLESGGKRTGDIPFDAEQEQIDRATEKAMFWGDGKTPFAVYMKRQEAREIAARLERKRIEQAVAWLQSGAYRALRLVEQTMRGG